MSELAPLHSGLVGYYRFNRGLVSEKSAAADNAGVVTGGAGAEFAPSAVPWEPVLVYTVDGVDVAEVAMADQVKGAPNSGGVEIAVTGFNFAPSKW